MLGPDVDQDAQATVEVLDPATITIVKNLVGGTNATFHFDGDLGPIALPVLGTTASQSVPDLGPGTYSVTELATSGWDFTSLACEDETGGTTVSGSTATIGLAEGETVTCTFTNTKALPPPTNTDPAAATGDRAHRRLDAALAAAAARRRARRDGRDRPAPAASRGGRRDASGRRARGSTADQASRPGSLRQAHPAGSPAERRPPGRPT